jgi:glutamate-1-semialdehyde 2,1-aminomutase
LRSYRKSYELYERAQHSLAGGISSSFRAFEQPHPLFYLRAQGARLWDVDGNESLDFTLSQGPMILGHSHPAVLEAVHKANALGQLYAAQHLEELELAETLQRLIPSAELVRFCLSGSEAAQAALRVARAYTGRQKFIKFEGHYHGWLDSVAFSINPSLDQMNETSDSKAIPWTSGISAGVAEDIIVLRWNNLEGVRQAVRKWGGEIAAVIAEPIMCNSGCIPPAPGFLEGLREIASEAGIVLIFDEIITGFRISAGGAQRYYKVIPDLSIFGKAMGSGFPVSALVGKRILMNLLAERRTIQAGTLNAQNASIAAALVTLSELENKEGEIYPELYRLSELLRASLRQSAEKNGHEVLIQGVGPVFHMGFTPLKSVTEYRDTLAYDGEKYQRFVQGMREKGIRLIGRGLWYLSTAHTEADVEECAQAARQTLAEM